MPAIDLQTLASILGIGVSAIGIIGAVFRAASGLRSRLDIQDLVLKGIKDNVDKFAARIDHLESRIIHNRTDHR